MHQRRLVDLASAITARSQDRHPDGEPRHDRVRHCVIASGLHDIQLADSSQWRASHGQGNPESRGSGATHDFSAVVLVDDLRLFGFCQLADCSSKAIARTRIWRRAGHSRGIHLCIFDVSSVSALGRASQKHNRRGGTYTCILVASFCTALVGCHFTQCGFGIRPEQSEYRPEPSRLLQTASRIA